MLAQRAVCCFSFDSKRDRSTKPGGRWGGRPTEAERRFQPRALPSPQRFKDLGFIPWGAFTELRLPSSVLPRRPACQAAPPAGSHAPARPSPPLTLTLQSTQPVSCADLTRPAVRHAASACGFELRPCHGRASRTWNCLKKATCGRFCFPHASR